MTDPIISVIMPVYNAGLYIREAIQSVIDQTFTDFVFIIINDGSTDGSEAVISEFKDERIRYVKHSANTGLINVLNESFSLAQGKYIIRVDADDISLPERFEKQVAFMEANPGIDISGTWFSVINTEQVVRHPVASEECNVNLLQNTVIGHPSAILRRKTIIDSKIKFDSTALHAEDYKFWAEAAIKGLKLANIPEILLLYRSHPGQISAVKASQQFKTAQDVRLWYAQHFFGDLLRDKSELYNDFLNSSINSFVSFIEIRALVKEMKAKNRLNNYFDAEIFEAFLDNLLKTASFRIYVLCVDCNANVLFRSIADSYFYSNTSIYQKAKFVFRSIQNALS